MVFTFIMRKDVMRIDGSNSHNNMKMERIADYIIRAVQRAGAEHIFMITGRGILYLSDAVAKNTDIHAISTYHEQGASYAAMAYSATKGRIGACLVSTGCAATNAITAALCAYQDNIPVVFISGQNMLKETTRYTGAKIRTYGSQEADIVSMVEPVTKYAVMLDNRDTAVFEIEKALYLAMSGRKGPVWIDVPLDVQNMRIDPEQCRHFISDKEILLVAESDVQKVARELSLAKRPLVLIGGGVASASARAEICLFVEKVHIPVVFSPIAADVYGTAYPLSIGAVGSIGGSRAANFAIQNADYLLVIGSKLCSQETGMKDKFARNAKITVVDIDANEHQKTGVHIEHFIHADAKRFLCSLLQKNIDIVSSDWTDTCLHWKSVFAVSREGFIKELKDRDELDLYSLMDLFNFVLPKDATVITDAGFEELIVPSTLRFMEGQRCLFPAGQGAMGYALPAIVGAYYAGRKNLICIVGDGSFMMNIQELLLIQEKRIPVHIVVINNNMYSVIRKRQKDLFRNRTIGNDPSDGVASPDFCKIAGCFGLKYKRIEKLSAMRNSLKDIFLDDREAHLIEVICTPDQVYFHESYALNEKRRLVHRSIEDMSPFLERELITKEMIIDIDE